MTPRPYPKKKNHPRQPVCRIAVTTSDQPGTDFTILACAQLLVYLAGSMLAGRLADTLGYGALFCLATAIAAVAVIATVRMTARSSVGKPA